MASDLVASDSGSAAADVRRILIFGMPSAGKTSLLGALARCAQLDDIALGFRLTDRSQQFAELRRQTYESQPHQTQAETVRYPITIERAGGERGVSKCSDVLLIDCDGRIADRLLSSKSLASEPGAVAAEVGRADAIIFVTDASATPGRIEADLHAAAGFLRQFQSERGDATKVGGLPVALVLSKCDLIAASADRTANWLARIEERKFNAARRFREFISEGDDFDFGDIDLTVTATAIRHPALSDQGGDGETPLGVAELFRDAMSAADEYRRRLGRSESRLSWTLLIAVGFVALCVAVGAALLAAQSSANLLASKIDDYRAREGPTAATRLAPPLSRKLTELAEFESDPEFPELSAGQQRFVRDRRAEIVTYRAWSDRLRSLPNPLDSRSPEDLQEIEQRWRGEGAIPEAYASEWESTDAGQFHGKRLAGFVALRTAAESWSLWYRDKTKQADLLLAIKLPASPIPDWNRWNSESQGVAALPDAPPSTQDPVDRTINRFPTLERAREQWIKSRGALLKLRDETGALGLIAVMHPVLRLDDSWTTAQAGDTLQELRQHFSESTTWSLAELPESAANAVRPALRATYQRILDAGRREIGRRAGSDSPTVPQLRKAASEAANVPELRAWRELLAFVGHWLDSSAPSPLAAFQEFLERDRFEVQLRGLRLIIPDDLRDARLRPNGNLVISAQRSDRTVSKLAFRLADQGVREPAQRVTAFTFVSEGTGKLTLHPGDVIWAEVNVRDASGAALVLSWWANGIRNSAYQFDRIDLPPRIHLPNQKAEDGIPATGVTIVPVPESGWPRLPDLLPAVR